MDDPEEQAKHLALAASGFDEAIASKLAEAAARARSRGALDEAALLAERSWLLTPPERPDAKCRRAVEGASFHYDAGERARAEAILEDAISATPSGRARARALFYLGRYRENANAAESHELKERAREEAADDYPLLAGIEKNLYHVALAALDVHAAAAHIDASLEFARRGNDPRVLTIIAAKAHVELILGDPGCWKTIEHAVALESTAPNEIWIPGHPSVVAANMLRHAGDLDGARRRLQPVLDRSRERGETTAVANLLHVWTEIELAAGNYDAATASVQEALELATQSGRASALASLLAVAARVDAHAGRVDDARSRADDANALAETVGRRTPPDATIARGFVALSTGDASTAVAELGPLATRFVEAGVREPAYFGFVPDLIEALVALGELGQARALTAEHEARALAVDRPLGLATAARCRALGEAAQGELQAAVASAAEALGEHERAPMPFERARTLLVKGVVERRAKHRRAARGSLAHALAEFERLGAPLWAEKARAELARIGGRPARGYELTPTEERVAALVAEGRTNREVAETLFMSVKTVEANLSRIYGKLGVRSRTELATRLRLRSEGRPAGKT